MACSTWALRPSCLKARFPRFLFGLKIWLLGWILIGFWWVGVEFLWFVMEKKHHWLRGEGLFGSLPKLRNCITNNDWWWSTYTISNKPDQSHSFLLCNKLSSCKYPLWIVGVSDPQTVPEAQAFLGGFKHILNLEDSGKKNTLVIPKRVLKKKAAGCLGYMGITLPS